MSWVVSLEGLTQAEKGAILWQNLEKLLGLHTGFGEPDGEGEAL